MESRKKNRNRSLNLFQNNFGLSALLLVFVLWCNKRPSTSTHWYLIFILDRMESRTNSHDMWKGTHKKKWTCECRTKSSGLLVQFDGSNDQMPKSTTFIPTHQTKQKGKLNASKDTISYPHLKSQVNVVYPKIYNTSHRRSKRKRWHCLGESTLISLIPMIVDLN